MTKADRQREEDPENGSRKAEWQQAGTAAQFLHGDPLPIKYPATSRPDMTEKINPIHSHLAVTVCANVEDAVKQGFDWSNQPGVRPIEIERVVVVRGGMESGKASVDFVLKDEHGNRHVFVVTRALLASIPG